MLAQMPKKVLESLGRQGLFPPSGGLVKPALGDVSGRLDPVARTIELTVGDAERFKQSLEHRRIAELFGDESGAERLRATAAPGQKVTASLPGELREENIDGVGFALIAEHPMALELAGIVLTMAMLGAVVLARKQVEIGEAEKAAAAMGAGGGY